MDSFKIYNKIVLFQRYIRNFVAVNIPSVHRDLRIRLLDESFHMVKFLYQAIYTRGNVRVKNITDLVVSISLMDFLLTEVMEQCKIKDRHVKNAISSLTDIRNMIMAWKKNEEESK